MLKCRFHKQKGNQTLSTQSTFFADNDRAWLLAKPALGKMADRQRAAVGGRGLAACLGLLNFMILFIHFIFIKEIIRKDSPHQLAFYSV